MQHNLIKSKLLNRFVIRPNMEYNVLLDDLMTNWFDNFAHLSLLPVTASSLHLALMNSPFDISLYMRLTTYFSYVHDGRVMAATRKGRDEFWNG